jgi:hypothetical protein
VVLLLAFNTMQPINYSLDVVNPFQAALQGFQTGAGIQQVQQAQQDRMLAAQQARQAMEAKAAEQARVQAIRQRYESSTEPMGYRDVIQYASTFDAPTINALKDQFNALSAEAGKKELAKIGKLISAIRVNPQVAQNMLDEDITAARNANDSEEVQRLELLKQTVETNPEMALRGIAPQVAALGKAGQEMLASLFGAEETAAKTAKTAAEARSAEVAAEFARPVALQELEKRGWEVKKLASDIEINKQNARIAAMNASIAREGNDLKRQELQLKVQDAVRARDESIRTKAADLESATSTIDNMINTADRILQTPKNVVGAAAGPVSARVLTVRQSTADFEELLETLGSQSFLAQIPNIKGLGALSNAEGEKLQAALQNLKLRQSPEQLLKNVKEAQRLIMKSRKTLANRYGVPETIPDTPDVQTPGTDIDALIKKYGGQ